MAHNKTMMTNHFCTRWPWIFGVFIVTCLCVPGVLAHPILQDNHDRTITVRLLEGNEPNQYLVRVEYRLEVSETTVYLHDMKYFRDEVNPLDYRDAPLQYYAQFTKIYAPILADRLLAQVNKKQLGEFRCTSRSERLQDENGKDLQHLRCDFVFESAFRNKLGSPFLFTFHDQTYLPVGLDPEPGNLVLSFINETRHAIVDKKEPDAMLRKRASEQPQPGDEALLRKISVTLAAEKTDPHQIPNSVEQPSTPTPLESRAPGETREDRFSLMKLLLQTNYGFWLTMLLALLFGAAHALTPGHGKTLVAAYLVGERGTIWHATFLGLVTTLTHTGVVMLLAIVMTVLPHEMQRSVQSWIQSGLGLVMGLIVACMGFWLLLQRLTGRADHLHLPGGHHHHAAPVVAAPTARSLNWWGLVVLGITGGIVPCWDAVGVLCITVGSSQFWLVLPAVLAFSSGLAAVLVLIGILVVQVPRLAKPRWGGERLVRALPIISAILVTLMGLWLCYEGVHGH